MKKIIIAAVLLFSFALLSKYEDRSMIRNLDFTATVKVQDFVNKFCTSRCDGIFEDIGFFASPLFSVIIILFFSIKRKSLLIPLLFTLLTFFEIYGKTVVAHPAPPFFMLKNPTAIFPTYYVWQEFSYPSGHAARAIFLGFLISDIGYQIVRKRLLIWIGVGLYVGLISLSRIYLGHHWLSDVVGGLLLGGGLSLLSSTYLTQRK